LSGASVKIANRTIFALSSAVPVAFITKEIRMTEQLAPGIQDRTATILGWLIFISFFVLFFNIINLPRTPLGERAGMQLWHDSLGWIVGALSLIRLFWFVKGPKPRPPQGMPDDSFAYTRAILFMLVLVFALEFVIGIFYAWGEARNVNFFGAVFPQLVETSESLRISTGYPHSALAFYYLMLFTIWLVLGWWQNRKYNSGWRRLFPGEKV
jgi:cytochrome b561